MSMEEVDGIFFPILKDIGCTIPDDITTVKELTAQQVYHIAATCLNLILPELSLPVLLPGQKAVQFRLASSASSAIKDLGFPGEMGYQNLLYPNEADVRRLISFLVERAPKSSDRSDLLDASSLVSTSATITLALNTFAAQRRTVLNTTKHVSSSSHGFYSYPLRYPTKNASAEEQAYFKQYQPIISMQNQRRTTESPSSQTHLSESIFNHLSQRSVDASLAELGASKNASEVQNNRQELKNVFSASVRASTTNSGVVRKTRTHAPAASSLALGASNFARRTDFSQESENTAPGLSKADLDAQEQEEMARLEAERAAELEALQLELDRALALGAERLNLTNEAEKTLLAITAEQETQNKALAEADSALKTRRRVLDLLPEAEANARKLQTLADTGVERLASLGAEWERVRTTLLSTYRLAKASRADKRTVLEKKTASLRAGREEVREKIAEARARDEALRAVLAELNALPKTVSRQVFIRRITDIVRNLDRQRTEIQRILADVRSIQKELNAKEESVRRSFDVADEMVYQSAKVHKDPTAVRVYRNVVELRQGFAAIVECIEKTGKSGNDSNDLQQKIDALEARLSGLKIDTVTTDLQQMRSENKDLKSQIKKAQME